MEDYKDEIWKPVAGLYHVEVSNLGRVRGRLRPGRWRGRIQYDTPQMKKTCNVRGYLMVNVILEGAYVKSTRSVGRLVLETFYRPMERGERLMYKDGNTLNCALDNLYYEKTAARIYEEKREAKSLVDANYQHGSKPVAMLDNGEVIATYKNIKQASEQEGFDADTIRNQVRHRRKGPIQGTTYTFRYCTEIGIRYGE